MDETTNVPDTRLNDVQAIQRLLAEYCHVLDERRFDAMAELFTNDATVLPKFAGTVHQGPEAICAYLQSQPESMRGLHLTANPEIRFVDDEARVRSDFVVIVSRATESILAAWGWYRDVVVFDRGQWRFRERRIETQWRQNDPSQAEISPVAEVKSHFSTAAMDEAPGLTHPFEFEHLVDELEIRNLVAKIAQRADMSQDLDEYLECFAEDALWQFGGNPHEGLSPAKVEGREAIRADRVARRARGVQGPGTPNRHVITTLAVEITGDGTAKADSYFLLLTDTDGTPRIRNVGHYCDTFVRSLEGWKLASRIITTG